MVVWGVRVCVCGGCVGCLVNVSMTHAMRSVVCVFLVCVFMCGVHAWRACVCV